MPAAESLVTVQADGQPVSQLRFTNVEQPGTPPVYEPARLTVAANVAAARERGLRVDLARLSLPSGWLSDRATIRSVPDASDTVSWAVFPKEPPEALDLAVGVTFLSGDAEVAHEWVALPVTLDLRSQFVPSRDVLPWQNSTASVGDVGPSWETFRETFRLALLPHALFAGLYAKMERIDGAGGGLCSGMVHLALERSLEGDHAPPALDDVLRWHGRQLGDRATLAAVPWFVAPSPRRAFQHFRQDLAERGQSDITFDIAQPKPWRRDLVRAFQDGHTVLPYGIRQSRPGRAEVLIYDPNDPAAARVDGSVMTFDLTTDRYGYPGHASLDDPSTTVFATRQKSYRGSDTAILASLANPVIYPRSLKAVNPRGVVAGLLGLVVALAGAKAVSKSRRR